MQLGLLVLTSLILGVTSLIVLQGNVIPPHEQRPRPELAGAIDFDRLFSHITPDRVAQWHRRMVRPETRLAGTAGANEVADAVEAEFQRLGLKTLVHRFPVSVCARRCVVRMVKSHAGDVVIAHEHSAHDPDAVDACRLAQRENGRHRAGSSRAAPIRPATPVFDAVNQVAALVREHK